MSPLPGDAAQAPQPSLRSQEAAGLRPLVKAVIASMLGESRDAADVEDATHETLRRAMEGQTPENVALRPWVIGIARHVALDVLRVRKRERARTATSAADDEGSLLDRAEDPAAPADERLVEAERRRTVRAALASLPPNHRQALELFHMEGLSYQVIGERLGVPLGTVATWVLRGRRALAEQLQGQVTP